MTKKEFKIEEIKKFLTENFDEENNLSVINEMIVKSREYSKFRPDHGLGWISLATSLSKKNRIKQDNIFSEEIVNAYIKYLNIDENNPLIYINLAVELEKSDYEEALKLYEKAILKFPENETLLLNYSDVFFKMNKFDKAKNILLKIIEINETNEQAIQNIAYIFQKQSMLEDAEKFYLKAFDLNPSEINYISLSSIYLRLEKNLIAEKILMNGIIKFPESERIYNNLIITFAKLGKFIDKINLERKIYGLIEFKKDEQLGEFNINILK